MIARRGFLVVLGMGFLNLMPCLSHAQPDRKAGDEFAVEFAYRGFGIAAQPVQGILLVNGAESRTVSRALLDAMQRLQHSIIEPADMSVDAALPPNRPWKTDIVPLGGTVIEDHNRLHASFQLPSDRIYGMQYEGEYRLEQGELRFKLRCVLHHRGVGGAFRPYEGRDYSGAFFFERVRAVIRESLTTASRMEGDQ